MRFTTILLGQERQINQLGLEDEAKEGKIIHQGLEDKIKLINYAF